MLLLFATFKSKLKGKINQDSIFNGRNFDQKNFGGKTSKLALTGGANCRDSSISPTPDKTYFCRFFLTISPKKEMNLFQCCFVN
jgi:hypothetical protein